MKQHSHILNGGRPFGASGASARSSSLPPFFSIPQKRQPKLPPPPRLPIDPPKSPSDTAPDEDTDRDEFVYPPGFKAAVRRLKSGRKPPEIALRFRAERKARGLARLHKLMAALEELKARNAVL